MEVDLAHSVHRLLVLEGDEAEAAVPLGLLVHQHDGLVHLACTTTSITFERYLIKHKDRYSKSDPDQLSNHGAPPRPNGKLYSYDHLDDRFLFPRSAQPSLAPCSLPLVIY